VAAAIDHPNICPVLDIGCLDGTHYLTMPFIDGVPLTDRIDRQRLLPVPEVVGLVSTIAVTLQAMHERGLMHRDLKPANVLLKHGHEPILMDFGLARAFGQQATRLTGTGAMVGTPPYMPPEQINGDPQAMGPGSDIYGLGVILFELLTGRLPFEAPTLQALYARIFFDPPPLPSVLRPGLDLKLNAICVKALAKKAEDRFGSMAEFAAALESMIPKPGFSQKPGFLEPDLDLPPTLPQQGPPSADDTEMLRLACPKCGQPMRTPVTTAGKIVKCPRCQMPILVPRGVAPKPPARPEPTSPPPPSPSPDTHLLKGLALSDAGMPTPSPQGMDTVSGKPSGPGLLPWIGVGAAVLLVGVLVVGLAFSGRAGKRPGGTPLAANTSRSNAAPGGGDKEPRPAEQVPNVEPKPPPKNEDDKPLAKEQVKPAPPVAAPGAREITNSVGMKLVLIPAGKFRMGSPNTETDRASDEGPEHEVEITRPFYMGIYEVTQKQYQAVMGRNPSWFSPTGEGKKKVANLSTDEFPVEMVSWYEAVAFCNKLSALPEEERFGRWYRLPTEAEWEYACRAGAALKTPFHFGRSLSSYQANIDYLQRTTTVGSYAPNAFGLFDMHGNVWEWCADWYDADYYGKSPKHDPQGPQKGQRRVLRGGSWFVSGGPYSRSARRHGTEPGFRNDNLGFRVVLGVRMP
jgi:formylglycine-generating enzyme required for sulfatase activity/serine/threonine protein kinase